MEKLNSPIFGIVITLVLIAGVIFKILHWPGAGQFIIIGSSSLAIYVLLLGGVLNFSLKKDKPTSVFGSKSKLLGLSLAILIVGLQFKILHWPGAGLQLIIGAISLAIISIVYAYPLITKKVHLAVKPEAIFVAISILVLIYGVSVGGSSFSLLRNVTMNAVKIENNIWQVNKNYESISKEVLDEKEKHVFDATIDLNKYMKDLKVELFKNVGKLPQTIADTIQIGLISGKDNYDIPTMILGLSEPANPKSGEFTATELREKLERFNEIVSPFGERINMNKSTNMHANYEDSWEAVMFYHYTLSQVVLTLNQIQLEANIICNSILTTHLLEGAINPTDTIN